MNQPLPSVDIFGGVNRSYPPHLLQSNQWSYQAGLRPFRGYLKQHELIKQWETSSAAGQFYDVVSIPTGQLNECLFIAISQQGVFRYFPDSFSSLYKMPVYTYGARVTALLDEDGEPVLDEDGNVIYEETDDDDNPVMLNNSGLTNHFYRPGVCLYSNQAWLSRIDWPLMFTDGSRLQRYTGNQPSARFVEAFYDHIVLGYTKFKGEVCPARTMWSDLYRPDVFEPGKTNEADYYDFSEWMQSDDSSCEITGMHKIGNFLYYYLPSAIVVAQYVGLPKVFRIDPVPGTEGIGCTFPFSLGRAQNYSFFYSDREKNFFAFDGQRIEKIGDPIIEWFLSEASISQYYLYGDRFTCFTVPRYNEVWWIFQGGGLVYYALVFNWSTKTWWHGLLGNTPVTSFFNGRGKRAKTCSELTGTCDNLSVYPTYTKCDQLSNLSVSVTPFFLGPGVAKVEQTGDAIGDLDLLWRGEYMTLVTGDRFLGNLNKTKECHSLVLNASYDQGTGVEVAVSVRDQLNDEVTWTVVGTWTPSTPFKTLTFPPKRGNIFRWRFKVLGTSGSAKAQNFKLLGVQEVYNVRNDE